MRAKKTALLVWVLLLLIIPIYNPTDDLLMSFEYLSQGSSFVECSLCFTQGAILNIYPDLECYCATRLTPYNLLFNTAMMIIFISILCKRISEIFHLRSYVFIRGGAVNFKLILIKKVLSEIVIILFAKLIVYVIFFIILQGFTWFILFDLASTFLTLSMFSLIFIFCKLHGTKEKIPMFTFIAGNMLAQIFSFEWQVFSIFVVASADWSESPLVIIAIKIFIFTILSVLIFSKKNLDQMLGAKDQ